MGAKQLWARLDAWRHAWLASPRVAWWWATLDALLDDPLAGLAVLVGGTAVITLIIAGIHLVLPPLPNPGVVYLPLTAMLAYYWGWSYGAASATLAVACVYYLFMEPSARIKPLTVLAWEQLVTLVAASVFVLLLTQLARTRHMLAEREAGRFAALNRVGIAVAGELNEARLLDLIARTARDVTGAQFAAFTLRPLDKLGVPLVPAEGSTFHLAAVVGVSPEQEALFKRMPLGGEGLLAPIFRHGMPVLVDDALEHEGPAHGGPPEGGAGRRAVREGARDVAGAYARGEASADDLRSLGVPRGHPLVRSFLGVPLVDSRGEVHGGLLLGHDAPGQFTHDDQVLLVGLAAQASVALENARLYRAAQLQAEELDAVFESIGDGISLLDEAGQVVRENEASRRLRTELKQQGEGVDAASVLREAAAGAHAGATVSLTTVTLPGDDGEERAYAVSASPVRPAAEAALPGARDGAPEAGAAGGSGNEAAGGTVVVWHNVTEARRLLEEQQRRAEAEARRTLLQTVLADLPSGVCLVRGLDARLVLANRAAEDVWGAPWREGVPMLQFLEEAGTRIFGVDGRQLTPDELGTLRALRTGQAVRHSQEVIRQPDGTSLPVLFNAVCVDPASLGLASVEAAEVGLVAEAVEALDGRAEPAAVLVLQDVTPLKEAERLKDEFIGIAAHELRNPMAALRGYADMLLRHAGRAEGGELADWQQEAVEAIDQATARLVDLTDDLLDVTRLQAGRLELRTEPADLAALARRAAARMRVAAPGRTLTVTAHPEYVVVQMDVARMEQVVTNLLNNAIKYSPQGGEVRVTVEEEAARHVARLAVRDQGMGIPVEQQGRIFGRFMRADNARHEGISGTGLGLFLCRELVERHGGRIWFESAEGRGSTFYVELPSAGDTDEEPERAAGEGSAAGATRGEP